MPLLERGIRPVLGLLDALAAPHSADRYIEMLDPRWSRGTVRATVRRVYHQTPNTVTLVLRPNGSWAGFAPGQHIEVGVTIDGKRHTRCYSPANEPGERDIELTIRRHPGGQVSPHLHSSLRPGDTIGMSQALGDFALPRALPAHLIFLCAGTGITPLLSMVRSLVEREHRGEMTFVQYAASDGDALYRHELAELALRCPNLRVLHVSTDETDSAVPINGLFSPAHLAAIEPDLSRAHVMACGPTALLDSIGAALAEQHLADRLTVESFAPPTVPDAIAADAAGLVRFARSETSAETRGETLLELAEANGLTPKYGCRMGICHTCTTPMTSGAVRDIRTGRVCAEPGTRVQICVSVPVADTELDL